MKAAQFIKDAGIERIKDELEKLLYGHNFQYTKADPIEKNGTFLGFDCKVYEISGDEVKRLVESVDFVKTYGGIVMAKRQLDLFLRVNLEQGTALSNTVSRLKNAVGDYESIYGEGNE